MTTINNKHVRFSELPWYNPNLNIIIGGVGGIGSWLSLYLARAGYILYLFDDDIIDETNIGGQLYSITQLGQRKVDAVAENLAEFANMFDIAKQSRYTKTSIACPIMFSCFDNMVARKTMFDNWKNQPDREIFIDGRMLAESFQIYTVVKGKESEYIDTLFDDGDVIDQPCSAKSTSHCGGMIGAMMMGIFTNYMSNIKLGGEFRDVPFKTTFEIPTLTFNTI